MLFIILHYVGSSTPESQVREAYQSGEQALQQHNLPLAEKSFLKVLELVPRDVGARANLGVVYMREEKWTRALQYLREAERLAPQVSGIRLNIGLVYYRQAEYAEAIPPFESVLQINPIRSRRGACSAFAIFFQTDMPTRRLS